MASKPALALAVGPHPVCVVGAARRTGRLCARAEFLRVQRGGQRFRGRFSTLLVAAALPGVAQSPTDARVGLTVSRKVGNAVVRNRVRRVLREAWRSRPELPLAGFDHVVIAFPQAAEVGLHEAQQELACLLAKARRWARLPESATRSSVSTG